MEKIFECIPNISEGRDAKIVLECVEAVKNTEGIKLLNYTSDIDHNRSVITFMGDAEAIEAAAIKVKKIPTCAPAPRSIDLGFASIGPKSVIAPIPKKIKQG